MVYNPPPPTSLDPRVELLNLYMNNYMFDITPVLLDFSQNEKNAKTANKKRQIVCVRIVESML